MRSIRINPSPQTTKHSLLTASLESHTRLSAVKVPSCHSLRLQTSTPNKSTQQSKIRAVNNPIIIKSIPQRRTSHYLRRHDVPPHHGAHALRCIHWRHSLTTQYIKHAPPNQQRTNTSHEVAHNGPSEARRCQVRGCRAQYITAPFRREQGCFDR